MIRGTTPTHTFKLPIDAAMIQEMRIIYAQDGAVMFVKTKKDCTLHGNTASVKLTQEETFMFEPSQIAEIQIRILTPGGDALASDIMRVSSRRLLEDEVME